MLGRDGVAGLACLAGSLWLLALTRGLPQPALVPVGPGFYPRMGYRECGRMEDYPVAGQSFHHFMKAL